ncbi:MAG: hypothetical protein A3C79_01680 [Candidatus Taylorbacteria bacterium RIFCSPHIGHO2_02_FULL_45_28]|uniref:TPM domain-containing protein n=1 Tax=Candidatus Taylorbacteria bacterium RIFCSPHIGHO2_12_FULL_45_16 TaxID=1802315 RepID=A0A1G2MZ24_9BACT|nr:MAG: hypothetical protein A2830_03835 [Candidatus Taylorbacteria bacterium RIFCSPHIGHO2_01_FULL_44_110]OHA25144.1 MAG: hypothetical protein A3C79_01680 [Candidatus Taylorbacteria bacterium RIFCSPHIGHO2_02_FULL_45_28]OHA29023.1 MAG: hypothetical protein A3F51_02055 [Candidatus Taylorbacteria bacterium RIFCSPHIGHO2_12_FULL_45_16]OHA33142.1 MAG: hypothetical protein A3A23_03740 [Candidatus Taylorbacteria bacterium RIFCSPLOWO2_01_FULL_45_59]OHA39564.1 MAG: hypothetical protein A3I98_00320 [Candi
MKKFTPILTGLFVFTFCLLSLSSVFAYTSPGRPTGFVNDFAGILSLQERQDIETKLLNLKKETRVEISAVIIQSLGDETIESYATKLFAEWGVGDRAKDRGLLILVAIDDRQMRLEVGYGLEGPVTDIQSSNIIRTVMTPAFREGKYALGISGTVDALGAIIKNSPEAAQYSVADLSIRNPANSNTDVDFAALFFFVIIILNMFARIFGKTKSWWLGGVVGAIIGAVVGLIWGFVFIGIGAIVILTILGLIFDFIVSKRPSDGKDHGGFWPIFFGGGHGGSGGGSFGGFGGGMSGGGGASGRW